MVRPHRMGRPPLTKPAELYACLYAHEFPAQAMLRLRPELRDQPFAVMEGDPPLQWVCSRNAKARALGVVIGMTRVEIETLPQVLTLPRSRSEEGAANAALLECAGIFSPRVENRSNNAAFACVIDIAGTEKLFGEPSALARALRSRVRALGIAGRIAVSCNFHTAVCMALGMATGTDITVIAPGKESEALSPLRLAVLSLSEARAETFALWGIHTLGMLAALPETALMARMGEEGRRIRQLSCGELPHLFLPVEPAFTLEERIELDTPVELLDSLLFVIGVMLDQLVLRANARIVALASVCITLSLEGGASHSRTVKPALPTNDRQLWIKLLRLDLEAHPPNAAILALTLIAEPGCTSKVQLGLFSPQLPEPMRLDVTLARIRAIVGEDNVGRAVLQDTHGPDSFRIAPFTLPAGAPAGALPSGERAAMRQLRPPESVHMTLREARPVVFGFRGMRYAVDNAYGPWRASGEWWSATRWGAEQWDLVARAESGSLLCCCIVKDLEGSGWQMAALYD